MNIQLSVCFFIVLIASSFNVDASFKKGLFQALSSNNESTCPQQLFPKLDLLGKLSKLVVYYEGDCASQGPYTYVCSDDFFCGDEWTQSFEDLGNGQYRWVNGTWNIWAVMGTK